MSNKLFYSYKLLPYLPSPSPSPPPPSQAQQELDSIDEYSELETTNNSYSYHHGILKKNKLICLSDSNEFNPYTFVDGNINLYGGDTSTDFCTEWESNTEDEGERKDIEPSNISTSLHSMYFTDFAIDNILCDSLENCPSMQRMIDTLILYQLIENDKIDDIDLLQKLNESVIDDYHHILIEHLSHKTMDEINAEFNLLHKILTNKIDCNFNKCWSIKRYHRIREQIENIEKQSLRSQEVQFYIDFMDTIHCYFIHSFDLGMRINLNQYYDNNDINDCKYNELEYYDQEIKTIKRRLNQLNITRNRNKFFTKFTSINANHNDIESKEIESNIETNAKSYSFGHKYYYWDEFRYNNDYDDGPNKGYLKRDWYIEQKYKCLKQEILQNNIYSLDINIFNITMDKAERLMLCRMAKQMRSDNCIFGEYYKIKPGTMLNIDNIIAVLLYCDYSELSFYFSSTFRRKDVNEMNKDLKGRNREYWNWSKILTETVELFGDNICEHHHINIFYHGISYLLFHSFITHFCGPTSTTPFIEVAAVFAKNNDNGTGIILELVPENRFSYLKSFNCGWLSCYGNENEILFFGGQRPLKFHNIRVMEKNENYFWFIKALRLFNCIIDGKQLNDSEVECNNDQYILPWDYHIIYQLITNYKYTENIYIDDDDDDDDDRKEEKKMDIEDIDYIFPTYIDKLFKSFCENKKEICIDLQIIDADYNGIKQYLFSTKCINLVKIDEICALFKNCKQIMFLGIDNISNIFIQELIKMINKLQELRHCNLQRIVLFNVLYKHMVLDNGYMFNSDQQRFGKLIDWEFEVEVKYRSIHQSRGLLKVPETSDLIINRNNHIEDDYVFNLLHDDVDDDEDEDFEYEEDIDNDIYCIPHTYYNIDDIDNDNDDYKESVDDDYVFNLLHNDNNNDIDDDDDDDDNQQSQSSNIHQIDDDFVDEIRDHIQTIQ